MNAWKLGTAVILAFLILQGLNSMAGSDGRPNRSFRSSIVVSPLAAGLAGTSSSTSPSLAVTPASMALSPTLPTSMTVVVYVSNFDPLDLGQTQPFPGEPGQDAWFRELAVPPAYGEIQGQIAQPGRALHEFTSTTDPGLPQTIDKRFISPPNLSIHPLVSLEVDFYAHTSDLDARNVFDGAMVLYGGPHPGFEILGFNLFSGNGIPKGLAGVNVYLSSFNGTDNNGPIPLTVGQNLAWDTWHSLTLVADQANDSYVSLMVNGLSEDLSAYALPRSEVGGGVWARGQLMEEILAQIAPHDEFGDATEDDVYWDNLRITVEGGFPAYLPFVIQNRAGAESTFSGSD